MASAFVGEATIDGIKYNIVTKAQTAEVLANNYSGDIVIPATVEYEGVVCCVTAIGNEAFKDCINLSSVSIPNSVITIGENAFAECSGLSSVNLSNSLATIGGYAFHGCGSLTSVTIPKSVSSIGGHAFYGCTSLNAVHITDLEAWLNITIGSGSGNPLSHAHHLFLNGEDVKDLVIPNSITTLKFAAFYGCSGLNSVIIPNSVTTINKSAFCGCSGLTSVTIPNSVTSIGTYVFEGCCSLSSIVIPNSVSSIGAHAFQGCSGLTSLTIGSGVTSIGGVAFASCNELTDVYCWAKNVPNTGGDAFQGSYIEYATLHVPSSSIDAYKSAAPWSGFKKNVALTDDDKPKPQKCDKPNIIFMGGKFRFECDTPGATFTSHLTADVDEHYEGSEVVLQGAEITYTLAVIASAPGFEDSEPAKVSITLDRSDVNEDGAVDVADIATIINEMAARARMQKEMEE